MPQLSHSQVSTPLTAHQSRGLQGCVRVPGDKSISHRALILAAMTVGTTKVTGLLEGAHVLNTAQAMRALGASVDREDAGMWLVQGPKSWYGTYRPVTNSQPL